MTVRVVGAGLGRTGTLSLKLALERLLGAPCYHMLEVLARPEHIPAWQAAAEGQFPDWSRMFADYAAVVDWPACSYWPELADAFPQALIVVSHRDPESWWESASQTIFPTAEQLAGTPWHAMFQALMRARFTYPLTDRAACLAAFAWHYEQVRATAPPQRVLEWRAADGWAPLCAALGVPVPDEPFPRTNTRDEFLAMHGTEQPGQE